MSNSDKKNLLFLCKCGTNVSNFMDLDKIEQWAKERDDIKEVYTHNLLCSPDGRNFYKEKLKDSDFNNIIIAACSPKMHEETFQNLAEEENVNMSRVQMANVREQCGWVTKDKDEATDKAEKLINAALKRAELHEELKKQSMECVTDVLIIGGGIAGIEAALTASRAGRKAFIVEKNISLGGEIIKTDELAPNMECAPCLLAPRLSDLKKDPNITVISGAEVKDVLGFYGNFTVKVHQKARYVEDNCIACGACYDACPVETDHEFHLGMGKRKAIYALFPGSVPTAAVIDKDCCLHFKDGSCEACKPLCPFGSINFDMEDKDIVINVGAIVVATGFDNPDLSNLERYKYGKIDNVYSLPEFERLASPNGPTKGKVLLKNGEQPKSMAILHCAGSLCEDGLKYCSGICCTQAFKTGDLLRKQNPEAKIYNIHNDIVLKGTKELNFYKHQIENGTKFIKHENLNDIKIDEDNGKIKILIEKIEEIISEDKPAFKIKSEKTLKVDMLVLVTGIAPSNGNSDIAELLNIDLDKDGFFTSSHDFISRTQSTTDGIYISGCAVGPANVSDTVTRSNAVMGDALSKLIPGRKIDLEILTSTIIEDLCAGCKLCINVCPYKAIDFDSEKKVSVLNEAICRGCGTCVVACPSGAATAKHFTDEQIYAEIGGVLNE